MLIALRFLYRSHSVRNQEAPVYLDQSSHSADPTSHTPHSLTLAIAPAGSHPTDAYSTPYIRPYDLPT